MKKVLRYCGLVALSGAALCLPNCDDDGPGPAPYTGPWKIVPCPEAEDLHYLKSVYFVNISLGYAVGCKHILKYEGTSWKIEYVHPDPTPPHHPGLYDIWFNGPNDGWAVGSEYDATAGKYEPLFLHYDGSRWKKHVHNLADCGFSKLFFLTPNDGWAVNWGIAHWDGKDWTKVSDISFLTDVYFNSPTDGWAVSKSSERIYHYDGTTWTRVHDDPWGIELYSVWFTSPDRGWAGGSRTLSEAQSCLMEYKNGKWSYHELPDRRSGINAIHFSSTTNGWAVEQSTFRWDGERWWHVKRPPPQTHTGTLFGVFTLSENDAWAVGDGRTIFHYEP